MPMNYRRLAGGRTRRKPARDDVSLASQARMRAERAARAKPQRTAVPAKAKKAARGALQRKTKRAGLAEELRRLAVGRAGELHRGGRRTTAAPSALDVAEMLAAAGGRKIAARTARKHLGPRESVVRNAQQAARARKWRKAVRAAREQGARVE